ncbi:hypothetical protein I6F35_37820 [Bradyrhizobium sp. BRP22]|uniref:hypothetical protein n=1 Tax=Bradyrhizobium sp. BRP22 TaxID=2793821 RepID=UPI001CD3D9F3|nr:hypothetical protein [Bradyrhizobium sp. BRP22]MCA1458839.1 hypothetical protein [Bradyrhizobium sp. BRP22]
MKVLLSIKPEYADRIFEGSMKYEFRKSVFRKTSIRTVVVYVTSPVGKIVGEFDVDEVVHDEPARLWRRTRKFAGISEEYFSRYFSGRTTAFALAIGAVRKYDTPVVPRKVIKNFVAPQSYVYVDDFFRPVRKGRQLELAV